MVDIVIVTTLGVIVEVMVLYHIMSLACFMQARRKPYVSGVLAGPMLVTTLGVTVLVVKLLILNVRSSRCCAVRYETYATGVVVATVLVTWGMEM